MCNDRYPALPRAYHLPQRECPVVVAARPPDAMPRPALPVPARRAEPDPPPPPPEPKMPIWHLDPHRHWDQVIARLLAAAGLEVTSDAA